MSATTADLVAKVTKAAAKRRDDAETRYWQAVAAVAAGKLTDPDAVAELLDQTGRDADRLAADAELIARRHRQAEALARRPKAEKELTAATEKIERLVAERDAAAAAFDEKLRVAEAEKRAAAAAINAAASAEASLRRECPHPAVRQRMADAQRAATDAEREATTARAEVDRRREQVAGLERAEPARMYERDLAAARHLLAAAEQRAADAERAAGRAAAELDAALAAALLP